MIIAIVSAALFAVVVVIGITLCVRVYKGKMKKSQKDPSVQYNSIEDLSP